MNKKSPTNEVVPANDRQYANRSWILSGTMTYKEKKTLMKSQICRLPGSVTSIGSAALLLLCLLISTAAAGHAQAPSYVVSGWTNVTSVPTQSIVGGAAGNYAVNSRGDFFLNDGAQHVLEYPATGGGPIVLWTVPASDNLGPSGVAVDPFDNLYVTNATYSGPGGTNDSDSLIYEFPYTNGSYPAPYIYSQGAPPPPCSAGNTAVCASGFYTAAAAYYWLPLGIAADGQGNTYMYTVQDNAYGGGGAGGYGIFKCNLACTQQLVGKNATQYTVKLSNSITSMIADYAGDVFYTDEQHLYMIPAGSPDTGNSPAVFDYSYNQPYGVTIDQAGNLYVSDQSGIWKTVSVETTGGAPCKGKADPCQLNPYAGYLVVPVTLPSLGYQYANNQTYMGGAVDNQGNIFFNTGMPAHYDPVPIEKASLWGGTFPPTAIGATAANAPTFNIVFAEYSATTITSIKAVQGNAPATEFALSPGSCAPGTFAAKATCSFAVSFTPAAVGVRTGAVLITDSNGTTTTTLLSGVGTGSAVAVDPGTPDAIGTTYKTPAGIAVDAAGDVYVADPGAGTVQEYPVGGGDAIAIGTNLSVPTSVAVDAAGDVYILNQGTASSGSVVEVPSIAGVLTNSAQKTLVSGLNTPSDLVLDGLGSMYITLTGSNQVVQASSASLDGSDQALVSLGYGLNAPTGIALDSSGNIYVADTGNNRVVEIGDGFQSTVGNGTTAPTGVAVDPSGSVMIADGSGRILRVPNEDNPASPVGLNQADQQVLASPLFSPYSIRIDSAGNLYASDMQAGMVDELVRTTGAINFGDWNVNTVSDTQTMVLSNIGNSTITLGSPLFAPVPAATGFSVSAGTGSLACASGAFYSGYSCNLGATFAPTVAGPSSYPLVFSAPAQNTSTPTINLVGNGVTEGSVTLTLVQTAPTGTVTYGEPITITANVAPTAGTVAPTGYVVFTFDGQVQTPIAVTSASGSTTASAVLNLPAQNAGAHSVSAYYEGDSNYAEMKSAVLPINITLATATNVLTIVGDSADPLSSAPNHSLVMTDTLTPSVPGIFAGTVTFTNTLAPGAPPLAVLPLGSPNAAGVYIVTFTYQNQASGLTPGNYNIVATYSGNTNYFGDTSAPVAAVITDPTFTLTASATTITSSKNNYGSMNVTVTDYSNFQGGVVFNCAGLPANAYCVFRPISIGLAPAKGITPNTIYPVTSVLQIQVDQNLSVVQGSFGWIGILLSLGFLAAWRRVMPARRFKLMSICLLLCLGGLVALSGCGSGNLSSPPTPAGTYPIVVTGTATGLTTTGGEPTCAGNGPGCVPDLVQQFTINLVVK